MIYDDAIAFWFGRINYEVRSAAPSDLKLERMRALLKAVGDPHDRLRLVHVTGTKGKGSTSAMIASVLTAAGYRVGLFTSPHLERVEERIRVNGEPISRTELAALVERLAPEVQRMEAGPVPHPTFFEMSTALGFLHFVQRRCEFTVIEVGLGGRFDSSNVCHPLVSVITSIGLDHTAQLGNTLEEIAYQKAGIIKRGVPVVCGVVPPGPRQVIEGVAAEVRAPVIPPATWVPSPLGLLGRHQQSNAAIAVAALDQLRRTGVPIPDSAVSRGLAEVRWPARIEVVARRPTVILDTAHNVPSVEALVNTLREVRAGGREEVGGVRGVVRQAVRGDADRTVRVLRRVPSDAVREQPAVRAARNTGRTAPPKLPRQAVHHSPDRGRGVARRPHRRRPERPRVRDGFHVPRRRVATGRSHLTHFFRSMSAYTGGIPSLGPPFGAS